MVLSGGGDGTAMAWTPSNPQEEEGPPGEGGRGSGSRSRSDPHQDQEETAAARGGAIHVYRQAVRRATRCAAVDTFSQAVWMGGGDGLLRVWTPLDPGRGVRERI